MFIPIPVPRHVVLDKHAVVMAEGTPRFERGAEPMPNLRNSLDQICADFVASVLKAIRAASLADLSSERPSPTPVVRARRPARPAVARAPVAKAPKAGRRRRASAQEVKAQKDLALATARQLRPGFRKGDVMKRSGSKTDLGRALSLLVADGKLTKKGDRRLTRYWVR
jgi:hypothetical protein